MDRVSEEQRSYNMSRIRGKDTKPEMIVRRMLFSMGFRYRLHDRKLPGRPDIVLKKYRTVVFVHGCFWHRHKGCKDAAVPKTRTEFWEKKFGENVERDKRSVKELRRMGWRVVTVWECQTEDAGRLRKRLSVSVDTAHCRKK